MDGRVALALGAVIALAVIIIVIVALRRAPRKPVANFTSYAGGAVKPICTGSEDCTECIEVCRRMGMDGPPQGPGSNACAAHHCRDFCRHSDAPVLDWCGTAEAAQKQTDACRKCVSTCLISRQGNQSSCANMYCSALCK